MSAWWTLAFTLAKGSRSLAAAGDSGVAASRRLCVVEGDPRA
jgi:hypothetical protein